MPLTMRKNGGDRQKSHHDLRPERGRHLCRRVQDRPPARRCQESRNETAVLLAACTVTSFNWDKAKQVKLGMTEAAPVRALVQQHDQTGNRPSTRDCVSPAERQMADRRSGRAGRCCSETRSAGPHSAHEPRGDTAGLGASCGVRPRGEGAEKKRPTEAVATTETSAGLPPQVPRET
jgi:hypothetical protein